MCLRCVKLGPHAHGSAAGSQPQCHKPVERIRIAEAAAIGGSVDVLRYLKDIDRELRLPEKVCLLWARVPHVPVRLDVAVANCSSFTKLHNFLSAALHSHDCEGSELWGAV